jgi:hypothetical protein
MLSFIFTTGVLFPRGIETCDPCHLRYILKLRLTYNTRNHDIERSAQKCTEHIIKHLCPSVRVSFQIHSSEAHYLLLYLFREFHQTFTVNGIGITFFFYCCILVDCWTRPILTVSVS